MSSATFTGLAATPSVPAAGKYKLYLKNDGIAYTLSSAGAETSLSPPVSSVFGRTGAVAAASNDYTWAQINKTVSDLADLTTKSHTSLTDIGTNTHAQLDSHVGSTSNPHSVTKSQVLTGNLIVNADVDASAALAASKLEAAQRIGASTYHTVLDLTNILGRAGVVSGGGITSNGDGTIAVAAGTGLIQESATDLAQIKFFDWGATASFALNDEAVNWVYFAYNAGAPLLSKASTAPDIRDNVILGTVFRSGTAVYINTQDRRYTPTAVSNASRRFAETAPYAHSSGGITSESGTRKLAISAGVFWQGLNRFTTPAFDSNVADTFHYYYRNGAGGWTEVLASTTISNTQYDDNSGVLATLTANRYGVHWVYQHTSGAVHVLYGQGDYTSVQADAAMAPSSVPNEVGTGHWLAAKVIIQKSAASFTSVATAFNTVFSLSGIINHNDLAGLQGGAAAEYYHATSAEYTELQSLLGLTSITGTALTLSGNLVLDGQGSSTQQATETPAGTTITTNWNLGNSAVYDFGSASGNITATLTNPAAGASYVIKVIQGATPRTLTFSPVPKWPGGTGPTISTANDAVDVISLYWDGTYYYGAFQQNFS